MWVSLLTDTWPDMLVLVHQDGRMRVRCLDDDGNLFEREMTRETALRLAEALADRYGLRLVL